MVYYTDYDYSGYKNSPCHATNGKLYDNNIFTFDIETTSFFVVDGKVITFDGRQPQSYYDSDKCVKGGFMYIWQFSINSEVVYGRTWDEFREFLIALGKNTAGIIIIYVHNLAFEFQFLQNICSDFSVFARSSRHTMTARSNTYHCEFRCSLFLTNAALENVPKMYNLPVKKMSGDLDYSKIRNSKTVLTAEELTYCEHDCLVVYELIRQMRSEYQKIHNIPLTQTGRLRRVFQKIYKGNDKFRRWVTGQVPTDIDDLTFILHAFAGGYTHANHYYTGDVISGVTSMDITSSYPTVMVAEKYPIGKFLHSRVTDLDSMDSDHCWIFRIRFKKIYATTENTFLSVSKTTYRDHCIEDNGRVVRADCYECIITDVDMQTISRCYKWSGYTISECMRAEKGYLDRDLIAEVLQLYKNKTAYKGVAGMENTYLQCKQYINAVYGMTVTNVIKDEITYSETKWGIKILTHDAAQDKLQKINTDPKIFLNQQWGVYVTAYARRNLWSVILQMDSDVVYCDTDSIKYIGDHGDVFAAYNNDITAKLTAACLAQKLDPALLSPADPTGAVHPLGVFDHDADYCQFVTLGAKKYAYKSSPDDDIHITLSGVSKKGSRALKKLSDFKKGFTFDYSESGKMISWYNEMQPDIDVTDYQGHTETVRQQYGINLMPTTYTIGLSGDYERYISDTTHYSQGGF